MLLLQKRKELEENSEMMLRKFEEEEMHVLAIQARRDKEYQLKKEKKNLVRQMKSENVERVSHMNEYKRMATLKKIEDTDNKVQKMLDQKRSMVNQRRENGLKTRRQKEEIAKVMEELRGNASKAAKVISLASSGKVDLAALTGAKSTKKKQRSRSANNAKSIGFGSSEEPRSTSADEGDSPAKPYASPYDDGMPAPTIKL